MIEVGPNIRIPKSTGTHADVLLAVGLADLLSDAVVDDIVNIVDDNNEFVVRLPRPLTESDLARIPLSPGYPFLKANEKVVAPPGAIDPVDYKAEKAKADRIKKAAKSKKGALDSETQQMIQEDQLRGDWRLLQVLNTLQGDETTNKVHQRIVSMQDSDFFGQVSQAIDSFARGAPSGLNWSVSLVQLFTPLAAKGYSRLKPDSTDRNDKTKEKWADPFCEWLRYRGYFRVGCPFFHGPKAENIRLLCPIPGDISIGALASVSRELPRRGVYGSTTPKLDALAVLRIAELLIKHSEEYHDAEEEPFPGLSILGKCPVDLVSGIATTHYQSMGNAKAVSAMSTLSLPGWFPVEKPEDAQKWLDILGEHQRVIRGLQDDHSDEIGLLVQYRRFLERRGDTAAWTFVEFLERYGPFVMRANGASLNNRPRWVTRFTDQYVRRILMATDREFTAILDDPGFEAVARAVRQATVTAQNRRAREKMGGEKEWREVRYELLHDLHRTRKVPGSAFIECVAEFVSRYNYENARQREMTGNLRAAPANVTDEEFKSFTALVAAWGPSTVGALLAAYGSCKEKWEREDVDPRDAVEAVVPGDPQEA